jgi:hypothetical protein
VLKGASLLHNSMPMACFLEYVMVILLTHIQASQDVPTCHIGDCPLRWRACVKLTLSTHSESCGNFNAIVSKRTAIMR